MSILEMKITKLEVQKNNVSKANVYIDNEYYCRLYLDTLVKYGLKVGIEVTKERLDEIILESEKHLALNFATGYLGGKLKTCKQIKDYLRKKEFESEIIEYVINKLEEYHYINDEEYIVAYINTYKSKYGKNKLIANLKSKGIADKLINRYLEENDLSTMQREEGSCYVIALKKAKNMDLTDYTNVQKLSRFLASRGFDFDEINYTINKLKQGEK